MSKVTFIGDVHGLMDKYERLLLRYMEPTIQVGDMGVGFRKNNKWITTEALADKDRWFHGNHDDPKMCEKEKGYLGRYGVTKEGIFYMGGAFSVDAFYRRAMIDWWPNEQLNLEELGEALDLYKKTKPDVVATHDCPRSLYPFMLQKIGKPEGPLYENATSHALEAMLNFHQPKVWIFGHWHRSVDEVVGNTRFICLNELESVTLDLTKPQG